MATIKIVLTLSGDDFDPCGIKGVDDSSATFFRRKDELLKNGRQFGHTEWGVRIGPTNTLDLPEELHKFVLRYAKKINKMLELAEKNDAEWGILIDIIATEDSLPAMYFPKEFINFASEIHADVGIDLGLYEGY